MSPGPASKSSTRVDLLAGAVLCVLAAAIGSEYLSAVVRGGGRPRFYQEQFGPAVMLACGHGYVNPDAARLPALDAFLRVETDAIACSPELATIGRLPLTSMQRAFRYLMSSVGWTWKLQGRVAWSALTPLYAIFYSLTIVAAYAVFRQGVGPLLAALAALALTVSTLHLSYLAELRDYSKAPFSLGLVLVAMRIVRGPATPSRVLLLAAAAGLLTGVGVGFRNDLLVAVPAFVVLFVAFVPGPLRSQLPLKAAAAALYLSIFLAALSPMRSVYTTGGGNSSQHLILLGLGEPFTEQLGIATGGFYEWSYDYKDELEHAMISSYADRRLGEHRYLEMYGADYDRAGSRYLADIASNFPADLLLRVYASTLSVLELPYSGNTVAAPRFIETPWLGKAFGVRLKILRAVAPLWPWATALTLIALTLWNVRAGLFAALLVLYVSGYPALQFQERHYFHLEFIGWWTAAFAVAQVGGAVMALQPSRRAAWLASVRAHCTARSCAAALGLWLAIAILLIAPLAVLRVYQQRHLRQMLQTYVDAPRDQLSMARTPGATGWTRFDGPSQSPAIRAATGDDVVHGEYIVADVGGGACDLAKMTLTFRYSATEPQHDFSRTIQLQPPPSGVTELFFPAYYHHPRGGGDVRAGYGLAGIDVPDAAAGCIASLARVRQADTLPLLLELQLPPQWSESTLYGTLPTLETRRDAGREPDLYTFPADLQVDRRLLNAALEPLAPEDAASRAGALTIDGARWRLDGFGGRGRFLNLVEMKPRAVGKGRVVLAQGHLVRGGISFGIVQHAAWVAEVPVTTAGDFIVLVRVPEDGEYQVVLSNYLIGASTRYTAVIDRAGWIRDTVDSADAR